MKRYTISQLLDINSKAAKELSYWSHYLSVHLH